MAATIQRERYYSAFGGGQNRLSVLSILFARIFIRALTLKFAVAKTPPLAWRPGAHINRCRSIDSRECVNA